MAGVTDPFHDFVEDLFAPLGPVRIRRMFGGAGVYAHEVMFALLADGEIYLKADDRLQADLAAEGSEAFTWVRPSDGKAMQMSYWRLPSADAEDPEAASEWARRALSVALTAKRAPKRSPKR